MGGKTGMVLYPKGHGDLQLYFQNKQQQVSK